MMKRKSPSPRNLAKRLKTSHSSPPENLPTVVTVPSSDVPVTLSIVRKPKPWWAENYSKQEIVAIDVEMVTLKTKNDKGKHVQRAGTVSIVNYEDEILYEKKVYHERGSFLTNKHTLKINGFTSKSLEDGIDFEVVRKEVAELLDGKLVIVCNGSNDFKKLDLTIGDVSSFEIQNVWRKWSGNYDNLGNKNMNPIKLRYVYYYYFGDDIHKQVHNATVDALATMRLFREVYCPLARNKDPSNPVYICADDEFDDILPIK